MEVIQLIPFYKIPKILTVYVSERRDLNPRPPLPQSGTLPSCATPRFYPIFIIALYELFLINVLKTSGEEAYKHS